MWYHLKSWICAQSLCFNNCETPCTKAIEQNYFITMRHQAGVHLKIFTEVLFRDILLTGTGHRDRRLNRDGPGQTRMYGRSKYIAYIGFF